MTAAHKHTIDRSVSPSCPCGASVQDIPHLTYSRPLLPPRPAVLSPWRDSSAFMSSAPLMSTGINSDQKSMWQLTCKRVANVLTGCPTPIVDMNWNGHSVVMESSGTWAYCVICHVTRKGRDCKHITARPCVTPPSWSCDLRRRLLQT